MRAWIVQGIFSYHGWEDLEECDSRTEAQRLAFEYQLMGHTVRIITRKTGGEG